MKNKIKTHKASQKRFKITSTGKALHNIQGDNAHLKINKNRAQKARKKGTTSLTNNKEIKKIKYLIQN